MAHNPFDTPPLSRVHTTLSAATFPEDVPTMPTKRMASTALPPAAPYAAVPKPWTTNPNPRATFSYYLTWFLLILGCALGAVQSYFSYRNVRLDRAPLCLVFQDTFDSGDDLGVFGAQNGQGRWLREVEMGGFGNGEFEMTTGSSNNSFIGKDGKLYLVPTLNEAAPFADGTTYNSTDCTWNVTAPNGGFNSGPSGMECVFFLFLCFPLKLYLMGTQLRLCRLLCCVLAHHQQHRWHHHQPRTECPCQHVRQREE
jgi:hypothetical protein